MGYRTYLSLKQYASKKKEKKLEINSSQKLLIIVKVKMITFSLIIMNGLRNQFVLMKKCKSETLI